MLWNNSYEKFLLSSRGITIKRAFFRGVKQTFDDESRSVFNFLRLFLELLYDICPDFARGFEMRDELQDNSRVLEFCAFHFTSRFIPLKFYFGINFNMRRESSQMIVYGEKSVEHRMSQVSSSSRLQNARNESDLQGKKFICRRVSKKAEV